MRSGTAFALILTLLAEVVLAEAPGTSPRPVPRPGDATSGAAVAPATDVATPEPPEARPQPGPEVATPATGAQAATGAVAASLRPRPRPKGLIPVAAAASAEPVVTQPARDQPARERKAAKKGSVCGDPGIKGENLAPITSRVRGCGVAEPVRVTSVNGVQLSQAATLDCETAKALKEWVIKGLQPAFGRDEVVQLTIAAHYICRPRNNIKGNKVSEHGRGRAIDISGFVFADGTSITVANNYNRSVRKAHKAACGIFGTTLGPGSDGFHEDHLHFDTASNRGGPYCR